MIGEMLNRIDLYEQRIDEVDERNCMEVNDDEEDQDEEDEGDL